MTVSPVSPALAFSRQRVVTISERVPPGPVLALSLSVLWSTGTAHNTQALVKCGQYGGESEGTQMKEQMALSWGRSWLLASWG